MMKVTNLKSKMKLSVDAGKQVFATLSDENKRELIKQFYDQLPPSDQLSVFDHIASKTDAPISMSTEVDYVMIDMKSLYPLFDTESFLTDFYNFAAEEDIVEVSTSRILFIDRNCESEEANYSTGQIPIGRYERMRYKFEEIPLAREVRSKTRQFGIQGIAFIQNGGRKSHVHCIHGLITKILGELGAAMFVDDEEIDGYWDSVFSGYGDLVLKRYPIAMDDGTVKHLLYAKVEEA